MDWFIGSRWSDSVLIMEEADRKHCFKVLRKKEGEQVVIVNGKGGVWVGSLHATSSLNGELTFVQDISEDVYRPDGHFHLVVSPTKNIDRMEWLLEKGIESGLGQMTFLITSHSERSKINLERMNKIAWSALKQCRRSYMPEIQVVDFDRFILQVAQAFQGEKRVCACPNIEGKVRIGDWKSSKDVMVAVGPEGDFSSREYRQLLEAGFMPLDLGKQRLRTETAALMVVMAKHINGFRG
jgi:16S rRNA (uracil1498-N3)-methyltransferase